MGSINGLLCNRLQVYGFCKPWTENIQNKKTASLLDM